MNLFENLQTLNNVETIESSKVQIKVESNNKLYDKLNNHYNGFVSLQDLMNYCSLDQFGELVQFCKKEADLDYDYEKRYSNWDEALDDLNRIYIYDENDVDSISTENIFNFFSINELEDFWSWVETEYDLNYVEESIKLNENVDYEEYVNTLGYVKEMIEGLEVAINNYDSTTIPKQIVQFINKLTYIAEDVEEFLAKENDIDNVEEATSGIGAGAYTTKAIDILPNNTTKPKKIQLESNATFYGNVFSDEELSKGLEYSKEHANEWMYNDNVYESIRYEDKDYWIVAYNPEDENVQFDNKDCIVALVIDEAINKYLAYFEIKYVDYSDGDPENGMKAPEWTIDHPFKIVELQ